jgi:glycosyltransferase involved in cell wall biosynthesis
VPAPGAILPAGRHQLRGWVWPKPGGHFVDVRARVGTRLFPGIHGRPRADLAAHFRTGRPWALAEFTVAVDLSPGPAEVVLEVLELEGRWSAFQTVAFTVTDAPAAPAHAGEPLRWHDYCRGLDFLLRSRRIHPDAAWTDLAAELAAGLPIPQDLLVPPQPFIGHADEPALVNSSRFGRLPVVGYLFHTTDRLVRLWATADLQALQPLTLGRATANLLPHFPDYPAAGISGYEGYVDVPSQLPNPVTLRLYAETPDGVLQLVQVRRTRRHDAELDKLPYAEAREPAFAAAEAAWRGALQAHGLGVREDSEFKPAVDKLRRGYLASATANPLPPQATPAQGSAAAAGRVPARITLVSHNLNLEGAPLFLLDLARHLAEGGATLTVVSASDGVLRERFAACGARIVILDPGPVFRAGGAAEARDALAALGPAFDFGAADLVIANTFTTFWAVQAAQAAGRPVLYYVHESTTLAAFYGETLSPAVLALAEEALAAANTVTFTSEATRRYHDRPERPIRAVLTPGWVDVRRIDAWRATNPTEALRLHFGVKSGELLVTNVGTVCDRKGQIGFVRAVDLFNRRYPELAARTRFVLLGGRASAFDDMLGAVLAGLALPNLAVHPESADYLGYYAAADLTCCSSYEESSPRVVLEAMACGTPLLAADIPGISEMARDGYEATLVRAGDTTAWAEALARLLLSPRIGRDLALAARARIETHYAADLVLPRHTALASAVAAGQITAHD